MSPSKFAFICFLAAVPAAATNPELLGGPWSARWIKAPGAPRAEYGVYHFRRTFTLPAKPSTFVVHVSADNRYQLFANGARVSWGPARGDLFHWRYETVDLAPHLNAGRNVLAAVVWNFGAESPMAQVTHETGFLLQGDTAAERIVDTNKEWRAAANRAYSAVPVRMGRDVTGYYVAGPGERVDAAAYPWGWTAVNYDDANWVPAETIGIAAPRGARDAHSYWMLVPRKIPPMEESPEPALRVRRTDDVAAADRPELKPFTVPANKKTTIILDQGYYTTGYPELMVSQGRGATVSLKYAESLFKPGTWDKGQRDEVAGKVLKGNQDIFLPDGGAARLWRPLWWRTWRYIELEIQTAGEPLRVDSLTTTFTGYPFVRKARIATSDTRANEELQRMLAVSWKTLRVDAHETFMDCAYYEQLQYIGDTRLEALTTFALSDDARLVKNAIETLQHTQTADGLTFARGPTRMPQYIPPFSLYWIGMLHDYWMYRNEPEFVRSMLPASRGIISWFASRQRPDGALGALPWWNYMDWVGAWRNGVPPVAADGGSSSIQDLLLLAAYQWAADLERALGSKGLASEYDQRAAALAGAVKTLYWDADRGLFADTSEKKSYSQHPNAFAILTGIVQGTEARALAAKMLDDRSLTESTLYFRYYIHTAMLKAGLGGRFLDQLGTWRDALKIGLTTWPEKPEPSRSDAHAWSSHIAFDFFRTLLGIEPAAPGFAKVRIQPHLGNLNDLSGAMPHPNGEIEVALKRTASGVTGRVVLPPGVTGEFVWNSRTILLKPGENELGPSRTRTMPVQSKR